MEIINKIIVAADTNLPELYMMNDKDDTLIHLWLSRGHGMTLQHTANYVKTGRESWAEAIKLDELFKPDEVTQEIEVDEFYFRSIMALIFMVLQKKFDLHFDVSLNSDETWVKNTIQVLNEWWKNGRK